MDEGLRGGERERIKEKVIDREEEGQRGILTNWKAVKAKARRCRSLKLEGSLEERGEISMLDEREKRTQERRRERERE